MSASLNSLEQPKFIRPGNRDAQFFICLCPRQGTTAGYIEFYHAFLSA
jgi:hypothetical protein